MASTDIDRHRSYLDRRRRERREYVAIFCLVFPLFLAGAAISRLAALVAGGRGGDRRQSILAQARSAASSAIPFAFR